ncbi:MAG: helicase C-terminal domain-containing protein [Opitutaceae bacterium]
MEFNLDQRTASLSVGDFSDFTTGPHDAGGGRAGLWRAQLGTHWHNELRARATDESPGAEFEIVIAGQIFHGGWTISFTGRIDQILRTEGGVLLREIKTVTRPLPTDEATLRADYPGYFVQLATYAALRRLVPGAEAFRSELVFVETSSGLAQPVPLTSADEVLYRAQLERVVEFLNLRLRARERLRGLRFHSPFAILRPGQETTQAELTTAFEKLPLMLFEAPTGFGKTGVLLEFALGQLRAGHFDRALYLTSKSTGQLQVVKTLQVMGGAAPVRGHGSEVRGSGKSGPSPMANDLSPAPLSPALAVWHVRGKAEHCINSVFHCVRESCGYLDRLEERWATSGLSRFYRFENHARDLESLRAAGRDARICPYEITRAALAFNDVWIGDYNYVFAPRNRSLFYNQPGFDPARTLLILDEAHNLPARVADAHSFTAKAHDASALLAELDHLNAANPLVRAWESWTQLLLALQPVDALDPALEADVADTLGKVAGLLGDLPLDYAALGPQFSDQLWQTQQLSEWLADPKLKKLLWCPRPGELAFTCIDAADAIGATLREYGGVVFASATLSPVAAFAESCGLPAAENFSLRSEISQPSLPISEPIASRPSSLASLSPPTADPSPVTGFASVIAQTPWRDGAYDVAVDARVDTTYHQRANYFATTAATIAALQTAANGPVAVFFPSYAYAESVAKEVERAAPLRVAVQPRLHDLAAQTAWVEQSLAFTDALFLVLGSSFAESIDALGGRITHAMVVGPALPEVNAVQRARLAEFSPLGREAAFRRVYQIPGMTKVNQALGRLVRAPGQRARVILHCRRFLEPAYASLLAHDYQFGANILTDADLEVWLARSPL